MAILAIVIQLFLVYGTFLTYSVGGVLAAAALIASGLPVYLYFKRIRSSLNNE